MDQDLEGELGIDTVKQAEIMAEVRDIFSLPVDEDFVLSDHPTLNHFTAYILKMSGQGSQLSEPVATPEPAVTKSEMPQPVASTSSALKRMQTHLPNPVVEDGRLRLRNALAAKSH